MTATLSYVMYINNQIVIFLSMTESEVMHYLLSNRGFRTGVGVSYRTLGFPPIKILELCNQVIEKVTTNIACFFNL